MASSAGEMKRANQCGQSSFCRPTIGRAGFYSSLPPLHCSWCAPEKSAINSHKFNETLDFQNPRAAAANSQVGHCSLLQSLSVRSTLTFFYIICLGDRKWIQYFPECFVCNVILDTQRGSLQFQLKTKKWNLHQSAFKWSCYVKRLRIPWKKSLASSEAR